jgi:hypothetical protein
VTSVQPELWDIWILDRDRRVLLTDVPGVPQKVIVASDGTLGGTLFDGECWISFLGGFDDAYKIAQIAAQVRGYVYDCETIAGIEANEPDDREEEWINDVDYSEAIPEDFDVDGSSDSSKEAK